METMKSSYIKPETVVSPKSMFKLVEVLYDGGAGDYALSIGFWGNELTLFLRWSGTEDSPIGNPQSRGLPTWMVVPSDLHPAILLMPKMSAEKRTRASNLLGLKIEG